MTVCVSPSSNRTCGFPASGSRRLFTGLLHELCHFSACSWLAGRAFAAISELPLPSPAAWVFLSLAGHHPVLCLLGTHQHNCPAFAPPRFPGFPCYYAGLRLLPAPFRPPPFLGLRRTLRLLPHPTGLPGYPGRPSRHAISADTARAIDRPRRLSGLPLTDFAGQVSARLPGCSLFDAH